MNPATISELYRALRAVTYESGEVHEALRSLLRYQPDKPVTALIDDEGMAIWAHALNDARKALETAMTEAQATLAAHDHGVD